MVNGEWENRASRLASRRHSNHHSPITIHALLSFNAAMKSSFKTVALIGKYKSPEVAGPLLELAAFLERRKVKVLIDGLTASQVKETRYPVLALEELGREVDLAIVIGGD